MVLPIVLSLLASQFTQAGGTTEQSIALRPGWNLVWLAVSPTPDDPAQVLAGTACEGVWSFVTPGGGGGAGEWVSYVPGRPDFVNTLKQLQGDRGYLLRMKSAATLKVKGLPLNRTQEFPGSRSTLFGLHLPSGKAPTFNAYFSFGGASSSIVSIYKLSGSLFAPVSPLSAIESDVSYWITFSRELEYAGAFRINAPRNGYQFGKSGYMGRITMEVQAGASDQTLSVKALPAAQPASGAPADAAGGNADWLEYAFVTTATATEPEKREWKPLTGGVSVVIPSGTTRRELEIRASRRGRVVATVELTNSLYQALIEVSDAKGNTQRFPAGMEVPPYHGVYAGRVRLDRVSTLSTSPQASALAPAEPLSVALILSLASPAEGGAMQLLDEKTLTTMRDGRKLALRYSALVLPRPVPLTGDISGNGAAGTLTGSLDLAADDPLNPYRHRYNPEHRTGFAVRREIKLEFSPDDTNPVNQGLGLADSAGNNALTGTYTEVIHGLSLEPIIVSGTFKLMRLTETTRWEVAP